ncbi:partitioning defective 3 homolog isoform X1 [Acropora millepora]|uniref:partitioning defective 3 homolog isoform X1 n=1 Tax=Acropora millepora TaxID=45264 RepID=UPI001CF359E1|nr:partitioning defective 3 homolog isoform X1 [Acropora millepora]
MKVTVCFEGVCVIVPCGNGDLTVRDLIQRSISRYRKATNKPADEFIQVNFLETSDDHGILDPDDLLCDVVDDKEKLVAIFEEGSTVHQVTQNGGCRTRDSSTGTASPDLSAPEDESPKFIKEPQSMKSIINKIENTNGEIKTSTRANRSPPPPVAPKPARAVRHVSVSSRTSFNESIPSEDSGISMRDDQDRHRNGSDSSKSEISENVPLKQAIYRSKSGETTFAAVGMPIRKALYNGHLNGNKSRLSSNSSDQADAEHSEAEDEGFSLGRNSIRKSMFADSPMMDRWAELQEKRLFEVNNNREEQVSNVTSPSEPSSNEPDFGVKYDEKDSITSESSGEPDMLTIELKRDNSIEGLGFTVAGYRTADGRELGLIVRDISPSGCAARDGRLEIADRIVEVNGWSLMDIPNERAEEIFAAAIKSPTVSLGISRSHTFVPGKNIAYPPKEEIIQAIPKLDIGEPNQEEQSPRQVFPVTPQKFAGSPSIADSSFKKVNKRILVELMKGNDGLGFSITTRDNPAGGNAPIFVKSILPKGAAIIEGQLRGGDQIIEVNGQKMNGKSQPEAVDILRNTRGLVKLLVQREEVVQSPRSPAIEVNEDSLRHLREQGLQVLTFKIPLDLSGAAGLGVSVKGKSHGTPDQGRDSPQDKGIFCKSIIPGGAAAKDGRLRPDDQLLRVNGKSLVGLTNQTAMGTLRVAMQSTRPGQAFIDVTIARAQEDTLSPPGALLNSRSLENLNAPDQERPIEAVSEAKAVDEPQNESSEAEGAPQRARLSSGEEDRFDGPTLNRNLAPLRPRNAVQRNDSYCVAVNKSRGSGGLFNGPLRQRPIHRPSPLAMENGRPQTIRANASAMTSTPVEASKPEDAPSDPTERPTSTVAMPTPPLGSTEERSSAPSSPSMGPSQELPPQPPPRWDSEADTSKVNFTLPSGLQLRLKPPDDQRLLGVGTTLNGTPAPPPPSQFSNQSPTMELPPSYDQALARLGKSPHTSVSSEASTPSREQRKSWGEDTNGDANIIRPPSPFTTEDQTPFKRDGFGRMSMSEKRGRAALDARQSEYFIKREQEREAPDNRSEEDEEDEEKESDSSGVHPPLRRADSEELLREQFNKGSPEERRSLPHRIHKSKSTGQLKLLATKDSKNTRSKSNDNLSFTDAVENANSQGEVPNGHARVSPTDEEVPITMRSNADFTAVQQKLAVKKPFYKGLFKMGKAKRGDYSLTNNESPAFKHTYNKEALIDFPAEQRYRQLVNRYGQERASDGVSSLPSRGKKKHEAAKERAAPIERRTPPPPPAMKVSRVTVSAPTRV